MSKDGVLFFGLMHDVALGCWNSYHFDYGKCNIVKIAENRNTLQFASGVKVRESCSFNVIPMGKKTLKLNI